MRVVKYRGGGQPGFGFLEGEEVLEANVGSAGGDLRSVFAGGRDELERIQEASTGGRRWALAELELDAPAPGPSKVLCVGQNYPEHAAEVGAAVPSEPIFFAKLPSTVVGPTDTILLPAAAPRRVDYEAELALVIGRRGRDIGVEQALDYVLGYLVANDVTARDWQVKKPGGQWMLGKSFDTFLPLGPYLVTADEVPDPSSLRVTCGLGGEIVQDDTSDHMLFGIPELIAYVSRVATLEPGDLLLTGTPAGTGSSRTPPRWLGEGDVLETSVSGLGSLRNPVRATYPAR